MREDLGWLALFLHRRLAVTEKLAHAPLLP